MYIYSGLGAIYTRGRGTNRWQTYMDQEYRNNNIFLCILLSLMLDDIAVSVKYYRGYGGCHARNDLKLVL